MSLFHWVHSRSWKNSSLNIPKWAGVCVQHQIKGVCQKRSWTLLPVMNTTTVTGGKVWINLLLLVSQNVFCTWRHSKAKFCHWCYIRLRLGSVWPWAGYQRQSCATSWPLSTHTSPLLSPADNTVIVTLCCQNTEVMHLCATFLLIFGDYIPSMTQYIMCIQILEKTTCGMSLLFIKLELHHVVFEQTELGHGLNISHGSQFTVSPMCTNCRKCTPPLCDPLFAVARWQAATSCENSLCTCCRNSSRQRIPYVPEAEASRGAKRERRGEAKSCTMNYITVRFLRLVQGYSRYCRNLSDPVACFTKSFGTLDPTQAIICP